MKILHAVSGLAVLFAMMAPQGTAQVIPGPRGPVEFIGLQDWNAQELFDAIQQVNPGRPFSACAVAMKEQLGFADAGAFGFSNVGSGSLYTVVVGVEDSTRVQYRVAGSETVALPESWQEVKAVVGEDVRTLRAAARAVNSRGGIFRLFNSPRRVARREGANPETLDRLLDFVKRADGEEDHRLARNVLDRDASWSSRAIATLVLSNFLDEDTSWHGLVGSAIDEHAQVSSVALYMLQGLAREKRNPVEWSGARAPLSAILGGTNPFGFRETLEVLVATAIDPEFGHQLIREGPDYLLAHAGAEHEYTRKPAIAFLQAVSGEDFGTDVEAWRAWIEGKRD